MLLATAVFACGPAVSAHADDGVTLKATVAGRDLAGSDANSPLVLRPTDDTVVQVSVTNSGSSPVTVRSVRLEARVLGLAFFVYTTRVDLVVAPGGTGTRTFSLDLGDLDGQATGLLPGSVRLVGPDRSTIATQDATWDVKGKVLSVYGVFGLAVAALTGLLLVVLCLRLVRRTLPDNRWSRALLFAVPGLGVGLVATFTLGVVRVLVPSVPTALALLAGGLVVGFVLGYLTPAPGDEADRDELDEDDVVDVVPVADLFEPAAPAPSPVPVPTAPATVAVERPVLPPPDAEAPQTAAVADDVPPPPP